MHWLLRAVAPLKSHRVVPLQGRLLKNQAEKQKKKKKARPAQPPAEAEIEKLCGLQTPWCKGSQAQPCNGIYLHQIVSGTGKRTFSYSPKISQHRKAVALHQVQQHHMSCASPSAPGASREWDAHP